MWGLDVGLERKVEGLFWRLSVRRVHAIGSGLVWGRMEVWLKVRGPITNVMDWRNVSEILVGEVWRHELRGSKRPDVRKGLKVLGPITTVMDRKEVSGILVEEVWKRELWRSSRVDVRKRLTVIGPITTVMA
jgi:hypothetical protein